MKIWLITVGEPLPIDQGNPRLLRTGILAQMLVERGHHVVWWTSSFNHVTKRHRTNRDHTIDVAEGYRIKLLHGPGYKRTVSLRRLVDHFILARKFKKLVGYEPSPDIILCSMPTIELSAAAVEYCKARGIPVVLDIRDLWPDTFLDLVPRSLQSTARSMLRPLYSAVSRACRNASAIVGSSPEYVKWGLSLSERNASGYDKPFFHGYDDKPPEPEAARKAEEFWTTSGVPADPNLFVVCFFGYFGRHFELETVIQAGYSLAGLGSDIRFVMCGDGDHWSEYYHMAAACRNIMFPGFVGRAEIWALMRRSSVGVAPYASSFPASIPNKPIEYLSEGLPVVSTLKGTLADLLVRHDCGFTYKNGDAQELARILCELRENHDRLQEMSQNARRLFQDIFTTSKVYGDMADQLEHIAALQQTSEQRGPFVLRNHELSMAFKSEQQRRRRDIENILFGEQK